MISQLLPQTVVAVEARADTPGERPFPGEEDLTAGMAEGRRAEFVTTRRCARAALRLLGEPPVVLRPGPGREPLWPDGIVGSLTHCLGYRAAVVGRATDHASLGIDAEPHEPLPDGVHELVTTEPERPMLARLARDRPATHWDRLLFSAKESVYKAWFPLTHRWLGFDEAVLTVDPRARTFTALLPSGGRAPGTMRGRFLVAGGLILTTVQVPPAAVTGG